MAVADDGITTDPKAHDTGSESSEDSELEVMPKRKKQANKRATSTGSAKARRAPKANKQEEEEPVNDDDTLFGEHTLEIHPGLFLLSSPLTRRVPSTDIIKNKTNAVPGTISDLWNKMGSSNDCETETQAIVSVILQVTHPLGFSN